MSDKDANRDLEANKSEYEGTHSPDHHALAKTITLSSEQFERLYLNPKSANNGDLRKTFANPTPLGIAGVAIGLFPLSIELSMFYIQRKQKSRRYFSESNSS